MEYSIKMARPEDADAIKNLLLTAHLPADHLQEVLNDMLIIWSPDGQMIGTAGFEIFDETALFRSFSILESYRRQQLGQTLFEAALIYARNKNIKEVYLLTETASGFFIKNDFKRINRHHAPEVIQQTFAFKEGCAETAIALYKQIEHLK